MRLLVPAVSIALIAVLGAPAFAAAPTARRGTSNTAASTSATVPAATRRAPGGTTTTSRVGTEREATQVVPRSGFVWPLSPRPEVLRGFVQPQSQWSSGHRGVDLLAAVGQPVLSAGEGTIAFSGVIAGRGVITVRHAGGLRTTYEPVGQRLASGTEVHRGTVIGAVDPTTGHCAPRTCLHWGAIDGQTYRDPLSLLGFGRPILLPLG